MSFKDLAEQNAVYAQRIMKLERERDVARIAMDEALKVLNRYPQCASTNFTDKYRLEVSIQTIVSVQAILEQALLTGGTKP